MGYGDATINKKMKNYLNTFHSILKEINNWETISNIEKSKILKSFINIEANTPAAMPQNTAGLLSLALTYQLIHGAGFTCPSICLLYTSPSPRD